MADQAHKGFSGDGAEESEQKKSLSLDDLMEAAGFITDTPKEGIEDEAAQPYRSPDYGTEVFGQQDTGQLQKGLADILGIPYVDVSAIRPTRSCSRSSPKKQSSNTRYFLWKPLRPPSRWPSPIPMMSMPSPMSS